MPCPWPLRAWLSNLNHKGGHAKGDPPKIVWCRREQSRSATSGFWRGRVSASVTHRQGKRNMHTHWILAVYHTVYRKNAND
eukprot:2840301-Ditylum_brightwellii.AAC.1